MITTRSPLPPPSYTLKNNKLNLFASVNLGSESSLSSEPFKDVCAGLAAESELLGTELASLVSPPPVVPPLWPAPGLPPTGLRLSPARSLARRSGPAEAAEELAEHRH